MNRALQLISALVYCNFYLIHYRNFPNKKGLHENRYLSAPKKLNSSNYDIEKLSLGQNTIDAKESAILKYQSQLKSPMLKNLMLGFVKQNEIFYLWNK